MEWWVLSKTIAGSVHASKQEALASLLARPNLETYRCPSATRKEKGQPQAPHIYYWLTV